MTARFTLFAALVVIISGGLVLIGWAFDIPSLKSILPIWVSMKANTALCFVLIGIALLRPLSLTFFNAKFTWLLSHFGRFCNLLAGLIGLLTLSEYLFDWNFGIDQWLFTEPAGTVGTSFPGRMSPETALCFILLAIAAWISDVLNEHYGDVLMSIGLLVLTLALAAILPYFTPVLGEFGWFGFTLMAMHTSILFALLGITFIAISWQRDDLSWLLFSKNTPPSLHFIASNSSFRRNSTTLDAGIMAIILVAITSALVILLHLREVAETRTAVVTQNLVKTLELSIEGVLDKIAISIQASADEITRQMANQHINSSSINQHIEQQQSRLPEVDYLHGTNEHGDIIYGTRSLAPLFNNADREYFIKLRDTHNARLIVTEPILSRVTNEWVWLIACRINKPDGSFGGVFYAAILLGKINALFSGIQLSPNDSIALRDTNLGLMARHPAPETANLPMGNNRLSTPFLNALKANPWTGTYISGMSSIDKISRTHSYRKNEKYGFTINVGIAAQVSLTEWHKQAGIIVSFVAIFIVTLLSFSRMIKRAWLRQEQNVASLQTNQQFLYETQAIARLGNYSYDLRTDVWTSSDILDEIFGIDNHYKRNSETWLALVVNESRSDMHAYLNSLIEKHLPFDREYRIVRINDGQERWVHGKGKLQFDEQGKPALLIGTIQDINERKLAEIEIKLLNTRLEERVRQRTYELETANQSLLMAKEAAEAANIAKSTFIATMSHELRTPLNAVLGFSELMSLDATATAAQKETLGIINRSGAHLLSMINDVLDISKIEAGRLELDIQAFDLTKLLEDIGMMIGIRAANKQLRFNLEIADDIQRAIKTDSGKLRQVLINLLGNAIKFTSQGTVVLRAHSQALPANRVMLIIEVIDSGVGIPADKQGELFKPFVQLMQENSDTQGTGLGLAISKSLIELIGGHISVNSEFGVGSTFTIELPVTKANAADIAIEESRCVVQSLAPDQPEWRLLVVDDNADNRLLLVALLGNVGFQVREAENGQDAIRIFEQWRPHLIWMDMRMPVLDGYEATEKIRQLAGGDKVKIIALTASVFIEQHRSIINAGCDAVLHKPFHLPEIFATLTKYLGAKFICHEEIGISVESPVLKISREMLTTLPATLRQDLHEASLKLDTEEIDSVITQIRALTPDIADRLDSLAKNYQFEQIIQLTEIVTKP